MEDRVWTISNLVSLSRVALVIPFWYCLIGNFPHHRIWAAAVIGLAVVTDFLDGYIARELHQISEVGKIIDPVADKVCVGVVGFLLILSGDLPLWYMSLVLVRDAFIVWGGIYIKGKKNIITQSNWPGKITVAVLAAVLLLSTLRAESLELVRILAMWTSILLMALSLFVYTQRLFIGRKAVKVSSGNGII